MMENQAPQFILVMITAPSEETAREIAQALLEKKLAACVNLVPSIRSLYSWDGAVNDDNEILMIVKSRAALFESHLVPAVQQLHPYDVPEIIAVPIMMGSQSYLDWIAEVTTA
jgi:periplasmic divalent cation tolerance protein